ncbi:hypothetical protein Btru_008880 [Bulinus truncatus]|nr:hypothetical protein Btru_008880 [Bulinus truncatus]
MFKSVTAEPCDNLTWNSTSGSWINFHVRYCERYCDEEGSFIIQPRCNEPACFSCDCDTDCSIYDTCCPRMLNSSFTEPVKTIYAHLPDAERFICGNLPYDSLAVNYFLISDCDSKFSEDRSVVDQCRNPETKTMDDITPYLDVYYGIVYKNKFCALCNGYSVPDTDTIANVTSINNSVKIASPWSVNVSCRHFQNVYHFTSEYEFVTAVFNTTTDGCEVRLSPPASHFAPKKCEVSEQATKKAECAKTDLVSENFYCQNLTRRYHGFDNYPNIFCYLCSVESTLMRCGCANILARKITIVVQEPPPPMYPPISLLLGVSKRHFRITCLNGFSDDKGECKKASCSPGKIITPEGHCVTALNAIRGLGYKLAMTLRPVNDVALTIPDIERCHSEIDNKLRYEGNEVELETLVTMATSSDSHYKIYSYHITAYIVADRNKTRDEFERLMLQMTTSTWEIAAGEKNLTLKPLSFVHESSFNFSNAANFTILRNKTSFAGYSSIWSLKESFIDMTYSLVCPHVKVNVSKITVVDWEVNISFEYDGRSYSVQSGPDISFVKGRVHICLDRFKMITKESESFLGIILYYFQVVCLSLSVACLILCLVTYFLFTSLRSLPGLNNISLCVSLATAQATLLVTVEYGVRGHLTSGFCLFNAMLLHFSWLASFAWMSACCIHMFLAFTSFNLHKNVGTSDRRRHFRYCLYGYGSPALIVILTLTLNVAMTSGASIGYVDDICFLDSRTSILTVVLSLLVPLCVMVISNGVLFTLTLREMVQVAKIQKSASRTERQGVMTYVKLSTLTGISCVVSAAGVWLDNDILQLITCPLMALQGVFIFFSFIVNKRVGKMYYDLLRLHCFRFALTAGDVGRQTASTKESHSNQRAKFSSLRTESTEM